MKPISVLDPTNQHSSWYRLLISLMLCLLLIPVPLFAQETPSETPPERPSITEEDQSVIRRLIQDHYVVSLDPDKLETISHETLEEVLDPNSQVLTQEEMKRFEQQYRQEFEGIGAYLIQESERVVVAETMEDGPAREAGLQAGDIIIGVDGESVKEMEIRDVVERILGPAGTEVTLELERPGEETPVEMTIVRQQIEVPTVSSRILKEDIGYLEISRFADHTAENAQRALDELRAKGMEKLVIDLRGNPGGLLMEAIDFSRLLIPRGPVVHMFYRDGDITYSSYLLEEPFSDMVLLVDEQTASGAEIFAAAFRDTHSGLVVGEGTYGKGSVQRLHGLPSGAGLKLTEAMYLSPKYSAINGRGVEPEIDIMRFHPAHNPENLLPMTTDRRPARGDEGEDVAAAQQRLHHLGYAVIDETGHFGDNTHEAVKQFQADRDLYPYGVLDYSTQRHLQRAYVDWLMEPEQDLQLSTAIYYLQGRRSSHEEVEPIPHGTIEAQ